MAQVNTRLYTRIPLNADAELRFRDLIVMGRTMELGEGGLSMWSEDPRAQGMITASPSEPLQVTFTLPHERYPVTLSAACVWSGQYPRAPEEALSIGLQFAPGQRSARKQVRSYVRSFRFRIGCVGVNDLSALQRRIGNRFTLDDVSGEEMSASRHDNVLGLLLIGTHLGEQETLAILERLHRMSADGMNVPILFMCGRTSPYERVLRTIPELITIPEELHHTSLGRMTDRMLEGWMNGLENERLRAQLRAVVATRRPKANDVSGQHEPQHHMGVVGTSSAMQRVFRAIEKVSSFDTAVMLLGETGTGKDLLARAIHRASHRSDAPMVAQNCAAMTETLAESELFGHIKGAFTGADSDHIGIFEAATSGTLFLDEVGELSLPMQAKLLHVLQNGELRRVGSTRSIKVDVRIICATNRDLQSMVDEGTFRADLYYRLSSFIVPMPSLRERPEDIPALIRHFLEEFRTRTGRDTPSLSESGVTFAQGYGWPGNIRQLQNTVERLCIEFGKNDVVDARTMQGLLGPGGAGPSATYEELPLEQALVRFEADRITEALEESGGVIASAARALGVNRTTLSKKCKRLGIAVV